MNGCDDPGEIGRATGFSELVPTMSTNQKTKLETFAEQYDGNIDALTAEEYEKLQMKLTKADSFARRGIEDRADTLRGEVATDLGTDRSKSKSETDVLTQTLRDAFDEKFTLDDLQNQEKREERIELLEHKKSLFEDRPMNNRVDELERQIKAIKAAGEEITKASKKYDDIDALAKRVTRDGSVLTATYSDDGIDLGSRETGGEAVVLKDKDSNTTVDTLAGQPKRIAQAARQAANKGLGGNNE